MTDPAQPEKAVVEAVTPPLPEEQNEAIIDAHKTFVVTLWTAAAFIGGALFIILRTQMAG